VLEKLGEIVERIGSLELGGVDQAHEGVGDASTVLGLVEQRVLAVEYSFF